MLGLHAAEVRRESEALCAERLEFAEHVQHEGVEVPSPLLAAWEGVGEEVEQHGFPAADFAVEEHALWGWDLQGGFLERDCAREGQGGVLGSVAEYGWKEATSGGVRALLGAIGDGWLLERLSDSVETVSILEFWVVVF